MATPKLPDSPQQPDWWPLLQWIANPFGYRDNCARAYGDTFIARLGDLLPIVFFSHPQAIQRQFSPYEYLPFGGGNQRCLGLALAQFEMKLVLATVLSNYELALLHRHPVKPARRGVTIAPAGGVKMVLQGRRQRQKRQPETLTSV